MDAANAAQDSIQHMEATCSNLHQQNEHLRSVMQRLEVELTELKADAETRDSALESLQEAMGKIERSCDAGHARTASPLSGRNTVLPVPWSGLQHAGVSQLVLRP